MCTGFWPVFALSPFFAGRALTIAQKLWTQREAAQFLGMTPRYLRESSCPKILLPGNGAKGQPVVRYDPDEVRAWVDAYRTNKKAG